MTWQHYRTSSNEEQLPLESPLFWGQRRKSTSSDLETDWEIAKKPCLSTEYDEPIMNDVPTTTSCNFDKNQHRFLDMEQLSGMRVVVDISTIYAELNYL
jgi:hypothetical protein